MQIPVPHLDWRILRHVARTKKPSVGTSLRLEMTRKTKDGTFLADLVRRGFLEVVTPAAAPFDATYQLTDVGRNAAEYGVYEVNWEEYKLLAQKAADSKASNPPEKGKPGRKSSKG